MAFSNGQPLCRSALFFGIKVELISQKFTEINEASGFRGILRRDPAPGKRPVASVFSIT